MLTERFRTGTIRFASVIGLVVSIFITVTVVHAQVSTVANVTCQTCVAANPLNPQVCIGRPCQDPTNGITKGICTPYVCKATSFSGAGGSGAAGLDQVAKILGDLMSKLLQPKPPKPPPPPPPPSTPSTPGTTGCTETIQVSDIAQLQGNPCARYTPTVSSQIGGSDQLSDALGEDAANLSESLLSNLNTNTNDNANGTATDLSTSILTTPTVPVPQGVAGLVPTLPGVFGDIKLLDGGATIFAGTRSEAQNTETAGFYGATIGGKPEGLVGQWCQGRPWASNFLSFIVPPTFFDSLCSWRGYQVGSPVPPQKSPSLQQQVIPASQTPPTTTPTPSTPTESTVTPKVDIWAVPAAVPLGTRTTIFWNTQGVTNCTETSPDGSFSHATLSGGAATVPITGPTTFTISCDAPDGSHVTGYVVVNLSI